jgi:hypothetical protein
MRNKTITNYIYCLAFFIYVDVACLSFYVIHKKNEEVKVEKKQIKEEVENIFDFPDLTLYT